MPVDCKECHWANLVDEDCLVGEIRRVVCSHPSNIVVKPGDSGLRVVHRKTGAQLNRRGRCQMFLPASALASTGQTELSKQVETLTDFLTDTRSDVASLGIRTKALEQQHFGVDDMRTKKRPKGFLRRLREYFRN